MPTIWLETADGGLVNLSVYARVTTRVVWKDGKATDKVQVVAYLPAEGGMSPQSAEITGPLAADVAKQVMQQVSALVDAHRLAPIT